MAYCEIVDCVWRGEERWHLDKPESLNGAKSYTEAFTKCEPFAPRVPLRIRPRVPGRAVDFTFAAFDVPVLSPQAASVLIPVLAEFCEFIPVQVEGRPPGYVILNVLRSEDCVDEEASELMVWKETDHRPELAGQYRQVTKLVLKQGLRLPPIFRLAKFDVMLFVSNSVAALFKCHRLSGVVLEER